MGILFVIPIGILLIGLVSLVSPNARSFSIPMIIVGAVLTAAVSIFFLVGYLKGKNIKKFLNGNYYVIETTNKNENYSLFLSLKEYKEGDYIIYKELSIPNNTRTVVLKVKDCKKLVYNNDKDTNFPVNKFDWSSRENIEPFINDYVFCKLHFKGSINTSSVDSKSRIAKYKKADNEIVTYIGYVESYNSATHSMKSERRENGIITEIYDFEDLFIKSDEMIVLENYPIRNKKVEIRKPKVPVFYRSSTGSHPACIVVTVVFESSSKEYHYLSDQMYEKHAYIDVPTHEGVKKARVVSCINYSSSDKLPYEYSKMKNVKQTSTHNADYGDFDYQGDDYPDYDYDEQERFEAELDRIGERAERAAEDGYYFDDYGVFHDLSDD